MNAATHDELLEKALTIVDALEFGWYMNKSEYDNLGNFIEVLAALPRDLTLLEIFWKMDDNIWGERSFSDFMSHFDFSHSDAGRMFRPAADLMGSLYSAWVDRAALVARADNIVDGPVSVSDVWKDKYQQDMFTMVMNDARTYEADFSASYLGGNRKYTNVHPDNMRALFHLEEISWSEFDSTFDDEANSEVHAGVMIEGVDSDFNPRWFIWKGSITEVVQRLRD